jgi:hypothetical protein
MILELMLAQGTEGIEVYSFIYKNTRRVYLIDTPGFDDTNRTGELGDPYIPF